MLRPATRRQAPWLAAAPALVMTLSSLQTTAYQVRPTAAPHAALLSGDPIPWAAADLISWGGHPYPTEFRGLWNDHGLYARFDAADDGPWHTMTRRDDHLWEEEVVEIFIDADRSGENYAELEISPANVVCDLRMLRGIPDKQGDIAWDFQGLETRVVPLEAADGRTIGWTAVAFMPWNDFATLYPTARLSLPPRGGRWRFNVFRIKRPGGPARPREGALEVAWAPTGHASFHVPAAFRDLIFADR